MQVSQRLCDVERATDAESPLGVLGLLSDRFYEVLRVFVIHNGLEPSTKTIEEVRSTRVLLFDSPKKFLERPVGYRSGSGSEALQLTRQNAHLESFFNALSNIEFFLFRAFNCLLESSRSLQLSYISSARSLNALSFLPACQVILSALSIKQAWKNDTSLIDHSLDLQCEFDGMNSCIHSWARGRTPIVG